MYRLNNIKVNVGYGREDLIKAASEAAGVRVREYKILKQSIDARSRPIKYVLNLAVDTERKLSLPEYIPPPSTIKEYLTVEKIAERIKLDNKKYIVVGTGPAGLFAALTLSSAGADVQLFERGDSVEIRKNKVESFHRTGVLDTDSNIQYGEGGAGTFSDGKLNTGVNSPLISLVLSELVIAGADEDIMYTARPHVGTDVLYNVLINIRAKLKSLNANIKYRSKIEDIIISCGKAIGVVSNNKEYYADGIVIACGHSARDTYEMLYKKGVAMESKSFAIGARIEHDQSLINLSQYGKAHKGLPPAEYRLSANTKDGRGCFTFCMCPGGYVMAATSENGHIVTNGMSKRARSGNKANSAVLVGVSPDDYGSGVLSGIDYQRKLEEAAYNVTNSFSAPAMSVKDLLNDSLSDNIDKFNPTYPLGVQRCDLSRVLPSYVIRGMKEGLTSFSKKIKGFDNGVLTGVETRSSSPVRIIRNGLFESNIESLYPCGEGAGYSGGITSSAVDGIKTAIAILLRAE